MIVSVIGGTGFIGKNIVKKLTNEGFELKCLVRKESKQRDINFLTRCGCELIQGDLLDSNSLLKLFSNADIIVNAAGVLGSYDKKQKEFYDVHVKGVHNIVTLASSNQKIIHISTAGVAGSIINGDERLVPNPVNIYEKTKLESEKIISTYTNYVILRPEFVYGPYDMHVLQLFRSIQKGQFLIIGDGECVLHPTYIGDLVNSVLRVIMSDVQNELYIIAGKQAITLNNYYSLLAHELHVKTKKIKIPKQFAIICAEVLDYFAKYFKFKPILTRSRVDFFTNSMSFNINKARNSFGYDPIDIQKGIGKTIKWYVKNGYL